MTTPPSVAAEISNPPAAPHWSNPLVRLFSPESYLLLLAAGVGLSTGAAIVGFHLLYESLHQGVFGWLSSALSAWGGYRTLALIPLLGGLVMGGLILLWPRFGPSMTGLIGLARGTGADEPLRTPQKLLAASLSLASGASLGPEGPSVESGGNLGLAIARWARMSRERQLLLIGAGAAAGIAAGFNAPIAGVFFAFEVVLGTSFAGAAVSAVLIAAVLSALVAQVGLGAQPAFSLPAYVVRSPLELPLYLGLGVLASLVSSSYMALVQLLQQAFRGETAIGAVLGRIPRSLRPALAGLIVGLVSLQFPQVLGVGYETIEGLLSGMSLTPLTMVLLLIGKLGLTALCLASGFVGGGFAPAMFLGAVLGSFYGWVLTALFPTSWIPIASPPAYAMVGMAAVLAGSVRAPLTAILLLFELTRDYRIVLPLMAAAGLSAWLADRLRPKATHSDLPGLPQKRQPDLPLRLPVEVALRPVECWLPSDIPADQALAQLIEAASYHALVHDRHDRVLGLVTLPDLQRSLSATPTEPLLAIASRELIWVHCGESLAEAIARMDVRGLQQLPVLAGGTDESSVAITAVQGWVDRDSIQQALNLAEAQDLLLAHQARQLTAPVLTEKA